MCLTAEELFYSSLKPLGDFRELQHGSPAGASLRELVNATPQEDEENIVAYLENGYVSAVAACSLRDVINPEKVIGTLAAQTDFVWAWYSDLPYYVRTYHVRLPQEFIGHVKAKDWLIVEVPKKYKAFVSRI